jgi:hypothetical protein
VVDEPVVKVTLTLVQDDAWIDFDVVLVPLYLRAPIAGVALDVGGQSVFGPALEAAHGALDPDPTSTRPWAAFERCG